MVPNSTISICQCSDPHFGTLHVGKLATYDPTRFESPAYSLPQFLSIDLKPPHFYLICGDLASTEPDEIKYFGDWAKSLPLADGGTWSERIYVVPGNHDNLFLPAGGNDGLQAFQ